MTVTLALAVVLMGPRDVETDITYRSVAGEELRLDFFPAPSNAAKPAPLVIFIHGGAWMAGSRKMGTRWCNRLVDEGFAAATISYRLAPKHRWPSMLEDTQAAVRYMRANASRFGIDPNRIAAMGESAGGHLALLAGMVESNGSNRDNPRYSSRVQAVLNVFGPTDMSRDFPGTQLGEMVALNVIGKPYAQAGPLVKEFSPLSNITRNAPPTTTIHGDSDKTVPVSQARYLHEALGNVGVDHELHIVPGMNHFVDFNNASHKAVVDKAIAFIKSKLAKSASAKAA